MGVFKDYFFRFWSSDLSALNFLQEYTTGRPIRILNLINVQAHLLRLARTDRQTGLKGFSASNIQIAYFRNLGNSLGILFEFWGYFGEILWEFLGKLFEYGNN